MGHGCNILLSESRTCRLVNCSTLSTLTSTPTPSRTTSTTTTSTIVSIESGPTVSRLSVCGRAGNACSHDQKSTCQGQLKN